MFKFITPRFLCLILTDVCNLRCSMCNAWKQKSSQPAGFDLAVRNFLYEYSQYVNQSYMIGFTGGEPLLYPNVVSLVKYARDLGFQVSLSTNGLLLDKEFILALKGAGLNALNLPLDGMSDGVHSQMRRLPDGGSHYALVKERILLLNELFPECFVAINTVITKANLHEILPLTDWISGHSYLHGHYLSILAPSLFQRSDLDWSWKDKEVEDPLWPGSGVLDVLHQMHKRAVSGESKIQNSPGQFKAFAEYYADPFDFLHTECPVPQNALMVQTDGNVCYCPNLNPPMGNIFENSFSEIIGTLQAKEHRAVISSCCQNCHVATNCFFE
jgi:MoaA/NifB/PqqE/SkfB family radical SAM enzyme